MMPRRDPRALAVLYFSCLNSNDWDGMRELWLPDGEWKAPGTRLRRGIDEVVEYYERCFAPWPEHVDEPRRLLVDGDVVVADVEFRGVTVDGRRIRFDGLDVIDTRDGRIARIANWYDIDYVRKALASGP